MPLKDIKVVDLLYVIIAILLITIVLEHLKNNYQKYVNYFYPEQKVSEKFSEPMDIAQYPLGTQQDDMYLAVSGPDKDLMIPNQKCSKNCCAAQWPLPPGMIQQDPDVCAGKFIPSNMTCQNEFTSGCVCVDKKVRDFLTNHGGNL